MLGFQKVIVPAKRCDFESVQARAEIEAAHRYAENSLEEALFEWLKSCAKIPSLKKKADYEQLLANYRNNYFNCFLYNNKNVSSSNLQNIFVQTVCNVNVSTKKQYEELFRQIKEICVNGLQPFVGGHCFQIPVAVIAVLYPDVELSSIWYRDEVERNKNSREKMDEMNQYKLKFHSSEHLKMIQDLKLVYSQFIKNYLNDNTPMNAYNKTWFEQKALHSNSFLLTVQKIEKEKSENALALKEKSKMLSDAQNKMIRAQNEMIRLKEQLDSYRKVEASNKELIHNMNNVIYQMRCQLQREMQISRPKHYGPYGQQCRNDTQAYCPPSYLNNTQAYSSQASYYSQASRNDTQPYCPPPRTEKPTHRR